ncbi:hypothetical protein H6P81_006710 [Aristolochia fimbriata]|uniref:Reverse transcriptase domain-containing protein n=1 Tax=Aristolochia fimbriata TaxID=158543 RepID=A0AAV7F0T7_ARIFI|nr:hypothetical protein H6P81_006710 [Aristolochia fimbriata]
MATMESNGNSTLSNDQNIAFTGDNKDKGLGEVHGDAKKCRHHQFPLWMQVQTLYNGVTTQARSIMDAAAGGTMNRETPEEAYDLIEEMTSNMYLYPVERTTVRRAAEKNPREQVKAISLRSGKVVVEEPKEEADKKSEILDYERAEDEKVEAEVSKPEKGRDKGTSTSYTSNTNLDVNTLPYLDRIRKDKLDAKFFKFLEIFKKLQINIPFVEALMQMPQYAKFFKDIQSSKRKVEEQGTVRLTENCSAILRNELPTKLKDLGSTFTIPCEFGAFKIDKALCDLDASINLMPLSIYRQLNLGELKATNMLLQFADRSTKRPRGIIEDVLIKIGDFIFLCNFVVLDMVIDWEVPLILGRPFLATAVALIDVKNGKLTLRLNDEELIFDINQAMEKPLLAVDDMCYSFDIIDECVGIHQHEIIKENDLESYYLDEESFCVEETKNLGNNSIKYGERA